MKILCTSDWHPDWRTVGIDRYHDVRLAVEEMVSICIAEFDAFLFLGDLCDPGTHRCHRAIALAVSVAEALHDNGVAQLWITGNHDVVEDGHGTSTLGMLSELRYLDVVSEPGMKTLDVTIDDGSDQKVERLNVYCLPFTPRSHDYDPSEVLDKHRGESPDLIIGHLNIEGITPGSETIDMPRGRHIFFPYETAQALFPDALLLNGHYHRRQTWRGRNGMNKQAIHIPGSPVRLTRAERDNRPGWLAIEWGE